MEGQNDYRVVVVMVPFPAQGHLNQLLHLSRLVISYGIPVHYAGSATHNYQAKVRVQGWDTESLTKIQFHDFQLPPYASPPPKPDLSVPFPVHLQPLFDISTNLRNPVSELLDQLSAKCRRIIVVYDSMMASVVQDVKFIPKAEPFRFVTVPAFSQFFGFWGAMPESDKPFRIDPRIIIPRCNPSGKGITTPEIVRLFFAEVKFWGFESGRIYNTSKVIEGPYVELLEKLSSNERNDTETKHFVLGPFNPVEMTPGNRKRHGCLEWLNEHDKGSVIYVSFGTMTSLTEEQIGELATGLEKSGQKFIWVLRNADKGDDFCSGKDGNLELTEGYEERVKDRGMVVREWAPQLDILAHRSIGGFMSHCGWNSCIESISMGVPIAAWPMHSDQPLNAILITEVLRIGVMVRDWEDSGKLVSSATIESVIKTLMTTKEGEEIRKRASELGGDVRKSVAKGGATSSEMDAFIAHITR
ncbi:zeatin O-glucosyltransferase-like [Silene latifolia]|uniref:zeatin O-glucosyltransferase-like n=1 Tax=Silene latifolia TaxID=37657 RepID=UPI003D7704C1